ncbi:cobalamin biosynthesis protein [Rhizobium rhizosphaerae]|uniref:cobalamin biosynthesis protein n=1 Tax=Xaviernesmea rhizosphaerae TaxID=1672749 RepID=UPI001FD9AB84|nr:cobalamin biosynthesis protein [Xaviernesmea rhizosphaerae]
MKGQGTVTLCAAEDERRPSFVLGLGCRRGSEAGLLLALAESVLAEAVLTGLAGAAEAIRPSAVASLDRRAAEPALLAVAAHYAVPLLTFPADRLEAETPRLASPSARVHAATGCHGVAESAALAAVGSAGWLAVPKRIGRDATAALAAVREDL